MAITGWFRGGQGQQVPSVQARIVVPDVKVEGDVTFLLDTGADVSLIMPKDARRLGIPFESLQSTGNLVRGIGGSSRLYRADASLAFSDSENAYVYRIELAITEPSEHAEALPSLLGRDILNRWLMRYEAPRDVLEAEVDSADLIIPRRR